jgi:DNA primase
MFPIRGPKGDVIAFGGRAFGDAQPKYMNSPQTPLFDKSRVLYGLDLARDAIRASDATVIVEGYVDVIIAHQYGFRNVVAPLGTALTADHVGVVKKLARTVYLALDADAAGIRATLKGVQTLRENLDGHDVPVPTPQGFIRWERELETEIKIIALPDGKDPDEVIGANPDQWRALMAGARPVMDFYITALTADLDLRDGKGKAEAVARLVPLVAQIANLVERAHHIQQIARLVNIEERIVRESIPTQQRAPKAPRPAIAPRGAPEQEDYLLGWLLRHPTARTAVQEKLWRDLSPYPLVGEIMEGTPLELFAKIDNRAIWKSWLAQPDGLDPERWAQTLDEALRDQAERVLQLQIPEAQAYRYVNDALECATILQTSLAKRWHKRISQQIPNIEEESEQVAEYERLVQIAEYIGTISTPKRSSAFADLHTLHTV